VPTATAPCRLQRRAFVRPSKKVAPTSTEVGEPLVGDPVDVDSAAGAREGERRDQRADGLRGGARARVLDAPRPVALPVGDRALTRVERRRLADLVAVRRRVQL